MRHSALSGYSEQRDLQTSYLDQILRKPKIPFVASVDSRKNKWEKKTTEMKNFNVDKTETMI